MSQPVDPRGTGRLQPVAEGALAASPEVIAALAAAADALWPRRAARSGAVGRDARERDHGAPEYVWRLSGRWWSKPVQLRRDRPWAAHTGEHGQVGTEGA
ncbi:MAG: hypothetical protein ACYCSF_00630 [Acidimicrobiales bacterium]